MVRRRELIRALTTGLIAWPLGARAQRPTSLIGVLGSASAATYDDRLTLIRQGLARGGFVEGRTVAMEYRWADGALDRLAALAVELVEHKVDVIIATGGLQAARAAMSATSTIPIVFSTDGDPVKQGLVASLNHPGGNATGVTVFSALLTAKRLEIFRELIPGAKIFGVLVNPTAVQASDQIQEAEETGRSMGFEIRILNAASDAEFDSALTALAGISNAALLVSSDPLFLAGRALLVAIANQQGIPALYGRRDFAAVGGLISYGANLAEPYRVMGTYAGRILKGEKPGDLPVEQPTQFELVINLNTARALGLTIPDKLLALADEIVE